MRCGRRRNSKVTKGKRSRDESQGRPDSGGEGRSDGPGGLRLDKFLKNVGIVPRRELAQQACQRGLIDVDGRPAKPAALVRQGQELTVRLGMWVRRFRVLETPERPVARAERSRCVELLDEQRVTIEGRADDRHE